ncbi:sporulation protein [Amylibacter marinus]|uniref:Sporulation protein n=1 Tax=Amylibacter marinus TaxID=1475483 RepID=A0ABQ5VTZ4_9RHOB|nr:SPOR domain-containing protein [Amylibacter marinus]GLQ34809.1 sporulation protein [Amylibacter marinus]
MSRFLNLCAATASIGLFAAVIYWGITLSQLDPNQVPVIKAALGPARIAPVDPGGDQANHQGLAVNRIQANGGAGETAMQVVLAPKPRPFQPEDIAGLTQEASQVVAPVAGDATSSPQTLVSATVPSPVPTAAVANAPVSERVLSKEEADVARWETDQEKKAESAEVLPSVVKSKRPPRRPAGLTKLKAPAEKKTLAGKKTTNAAIAKGTPLVQIGAFDNTTVAESEWAKFSIKHHDLMGNRQSVIQKISNSDKTFYRLRIRGFDTSKDAKRFCSALKARGTDCITTTAR